MRIKKSKIAKQLGLGLCALAFSFAAQAKDFRLGLITPASHIWTQAATDFAKDFEAASNNEHKVAIFPAAQLGNEAQMLQQLQTGALDMAFLTIAELTNRYPDIGALYAPYLVSSVEQADKILESAPAQQLLTQLPSKVGVVGVTYGTGGLRQIVSAKTVDKVEDLKGKKMRITPLDPLQDFYRDLGTAPIALPLSGVYDALSNGQVDAIDMDLELIIGLKFYDKAQTVLLSNHMMFPVVGVVSARVWAGLSDQDKENINVLMKKHLDKTFPLYVEKELEWEKALEQTGISVKKVGPEFFADAMGKWEQKWTKKTPVLAELREASASLKAQ